MRTLSLLVAFSISLASAQAGTPGTNGAGKTRSWTAIDGAFNGPLNAAFFSVVDDMVTLSYTEHYNVTGRDIYGRTVRQTGKRTIPIKVPLAGLCASDRRWIEEKNPCETCLTERSKKGAAGTLAPKTGFYRVTKIVDTDTAMLEYVRGDKAVWSFSLRSRLVQHLSASERYDTISCDLVPQFNTLSKSRKEQYGVDFKITDVRTKSGKHANLVEDYR